MIKSILKYAVMIIAITAGAIGADFLKSQKSEAATNASSETGHDAVKDSHAKEDKKKSHGKKDSHGKDMESGGTSYLKFKRQFVVPVTKNGRIDSLVIMNFNLILNSHAPENSFNMEPKLRDAFTRELLDLSNAGYFGDNITSPDTYDKVRSALLLAARRIIEDGVEDVLILDIAKQDQ